MLGDELEIGDKVLWADPDDDARDLNRVWEVYAIQSEELVKISTGKLGEKGYSEAEVPPTELVKRSSIIHVEIAQTEISTNYHNQIISESHIIYLKLNIDSRASSDTRTVFLFLTPSPG